MKKKEIAFLCIILGASILTRGLTLLRPNLAGDETSVGLMSLRVMKGDFPVFYYGQNFMGSLEAFLMGSFFQFFGSSPGTLELLPAILSILFLLLLYSLSKNFFDCKTALISLALLSIPPFFLMGWSHEARLHYHLAIIFGNFLFLITYQLVNRKNSPSKKGLLFLVLGLISGIAWWTNYLIITYILPVGFFLFQKNKKTLFRKNFFFLLFMFLVGSLPLWMFNVIHHFPITWLGGLAKPSDIFPYLKDFFINAFPILLGFLPPLNNDYFDLSLYVIIGPLYVTAIIYYGTRGLGALKSTQLAHPGKEILFYLFLITMMLNLLTNYGIRLSDDDQKYLLPLYTCLPIFVSVLLRDISKKSLFLSFFLLGLILFSNLAGNIRHDSWIIFNSQKNLTYQQAERMEGRLIDFLITKGYTRLYHNGSLGSRLIFKSKEALISAHPYQEGHLKYADLVDASPKAAYLSKEGDTVFEENMKGIGGSYRKVAAPGGYFVYTDFKPPQGAYRMISRDLWTGTANINPLEIKNAFDGDITTSWGIQDSQRQEAYVLLDLGKVETIGKISYITASYREVPVGYRVSVSLDGKTWKIVSEVREYKGPIFWSGPNPLTKVRHGRVETVFPPHQGRFLKISLLRGSTHSYWSISELFLFSPEDKKPTIKSWSSEVQEIVLLMNFLKTQKFNFIYADHWLSAVIRVKSNWKIGTVISNYFTGDNGENEPPADSFERARLDSKVALVVEKEDSDLENLLLDSKVDHRKKEIGSFMVYFDFATRKDPTPLPAKDWSVSSNANPRDAEKAIDGDPATRWTSGKPQEPGMYYQIDLNTIQSVKGCTLFLGKSINDYPRSLRLFSSLDGNTWQALKTTTSSDLYWTGKTLLRMTGERTHYVFPSASLRYLRLIQEGQDPVHYWSIHELKLF